MAAPFEGLFGDTSELRTIQFLLPVRDLKFNISELARETRISRQTMMRVVAKLTKWNVLKIAGRYGGANYYTLNDGSGFIKAFEDLDNCIIGQMLGETTIPEMTVPSGEQCSFAPLSQPELFKLHDYSDIERWMATKLEKESNYLDIIEGSRSTVAKGEIHATAA